jgi:hypothetical protein
MVVGNKGGEWGIHEEGRENLMRGRADVGNSEEINRGDARRIVRWSWQGRNKRKIWRWYW